MSKTLVDKKINRYVRRLNRAVQRDVFKDRFELRQFRKTCCDGIQYYLYQLIDRADPERNMITRGWLSSGDILILHQLDIEMNNFIVESDFWSKYKKRLES